MEQFNLNSEQIIFLEKYYSDNKIVKTVLESYKGYCFKVETDTFLDFMDYIEDQSVNWMGPDYEATQETIMLESIRDDIYYQTN